VSAVTIRTLPQRDPAATPADALEYSAGFHNEHATEALAGALPQGQFSPQAVPFGLYAEKFSGTAFTVARRDNRRTWCYRIRPSVRQGPHTAYAQARLLTAPLRNAFAPPDPLRWSPWPVPAMPTDFVDGLVTLAFSSITTANCCSCRSRAGCGWTPNADAWPSRPAKSRSCRAE